MGGKWKVHNPAEQNMDDTIPSHLLLIMDRIPMPSYPNPTTNIEWKWKIYIYFWIIDIYGSSQANGWSHTIDAAAVAGWNFSSFYSIRVTIGKLIFFSLYIILLRSDRKWALYFQIQLMTIGWVTHFSSVQSVSRRQKSVKQMKLSAKSSFV